MAKNKAKKKRTESSEGASFHPRKLARSVAKANQRRSGMRRINHHFCENWRNWVGVR